MKTIIGSNPKWCSMLVLLLLFPIVAFCQQKITIKDQDGMALGHFVVQSYFLIDGKEIELNGNIPTAESTVLNNQFRLKIGSLVWFDPNKKDALTIHTNNINVNNVDDVRIDLKTNERNLIADSNKPIVIDFTTQDFGDFKLDVPFKSSDYNGRFLQPLSVQNVSKIKSRDIGLIWKSVDTDDPNEIKGFIEEYENVPGAKKYLKSANRKLEKFAKLEKERAQKEAAISEVEGENEVEKKEALRNIENLESDVEEIVKDARAPDEPVEVEKMRSIVIEYENDIQAANVSENDLPVRIQLLTEGQGIDDIDNMIDGIEFEDQDDITYVIDNDLLNKHNFIGDFVKLIVVNSHEKILIEQPLNHLKKEAKSYNTLIVLGLLGLLSGIGFMVYKKRKDQRNQQAQNKKKLANKIKQHQATVENLHTPGQASNMSATPSNKSNQKIVIGGKKSTRNPKASKPAMKNTSSSKIKIVSHKVQSNSINEDKFKELLAAPGYTKVMLSDIWKDTAISGVHINRVFGEEMQAFLAESSTSGIMNELQGAVPEVGGFIMGRYYDDTNDIQLFVEKFVPFVPEYNDVFKIEIGTKTIVEELGDAQDKFPELDVIGWFHTHPGHGLFLSVSDLSVQRHFPKQFQVAMEIDSLTKGLDMSMFSRMKNGQINNTQLRKEGAEWFSWVEIEKELGL